MRVVSAINSERISLGKRGENRACKIVFPEPAVWQKMYGDGVAQLINQRPTENTSYPVVLLEEDGSAVWEITDTDTAISGAGRCELRYLVDDAVVKSKTYYTSVMASLPDESAPPSEPEDTYMEQIVAQGAVAIQAAAEAKKYTEQSAVYAQNAAVYAKNAGEQAEEAETFAQNAETSAKNAAQSEAESKASEENAKSSASNAANSENSARASEEAASKSESNAKFSESSAKESEAKAAASASGAAESANSAVEAANRAENAAVAIIASPIVRYDAQTLTDEEKAVARENIGATTVEEVLAALPIYGGEFS